MQLDLKGVAIGQLGSMREGGRRTMWFFALLMLFPVSNSCTVFRIAKGFCFPCGTDRFVLSPKALENVNRRIFWSTTMEYRVRCVLDREL